MAKPTLDNIEIEVLERKMDSLQIELLKPEVLYHDHSLELQQFRDYNARYHQLTGCWYSHSMELRE